MLFCASFFSPSADSWILPAFLAVDSGTPAAVALGVVAAVNAVIAIFYYANVARLMWMSPVADGDRTPIRVPPALQASLGLSVIVVVVIGIYPQLFAHLGDVASLVR